MRCEPIRVSDRVTVTFVMNNRHLRITGKCILASDLNESWQVRGSFRSVDDDVTEHTIDLYKHEGNYEVSYYGARLVSHFENYSATERVMGGALRELRTM